MSQEETPHNCETCNKSYPACGHKKRTGIGFCRDWEDQVKLALDENKATTEGKQ